MEIHLRLKFKVKKGDYRKRLSKRARLLIMSKQEFHPGFVNIFESENVQLILKSEGLV